MDLEFEEIRELVAAFADEATEALVNFEQVLAAAPVGAVRSGSFSDHLRPLHTLKGNAGMLGFQAWSKVIHALESWIKADVPLGPEDVSFLFDVIDSLIGALDAMRRGAGEPEELVRIAEALEARAHTSQVEAPSTGVPMDIPLTDERFEVATSPTSTGIETLRISVEVADRLRQAVDELAMALHAVVDRLEQRVLPDLPRSEARRLRELLDRFEERANRVQQVTMTIRLLPLAVILRRVPRIVRDAARRVGKDVEVVIEGEDVQADKTVVDRLADVLVHVIRNAVDHGIESPEEREALGKPRQGRIHVQARTVGETVEIAVTDDGRGIDVERVRARLIALELLDRETAERLSDDAVLRWLFRPGFSTKEETTELSGRGVGLDAVEATVRSLGGTVEVESTVGRGTTVRLRVPTSTALVEVLIVRIAAGSAAVPLGRVRGMQRFDREALAEVAGVPQYPWQGELIPCRPLGALLTGRLGGPAVEAGYVLVVEHSDGLLGLLVDEVREKSRSILHGLGEPLLHAGPFSGVLIRGEGVVVPVVDPDRLAVLESEVTV